MIIRVKHEKNYTVISDQSLRDDRLSFRATGVLAYLLSLPDGTKVSGKQMTAAKREGRDAILSALGELEKAGYLVRSRTQSANGTWFTTCVLRERPPENPSPSPENQGSVFQGSVFQASKAFSTSIEYQEGNASLKTPQPPLPAEELRERLRAHPVFPNRQEEEAS